jgi:PIN domain nuclease of toxin-antitoxin system
VNCLLDTHTFIFCAFEPSKLGKRAKQLVLDKDNETFVSVVSFMEISLKYAIGKLHLNNISPDDMPRICRDMGLTILDLSASDAASFHRLPKMPHKDPFDRMLIWQAIRQDLTLISKDASFREYEEMGLRVVY